MKKIKNILFNEFTYFFLLLLLSLFLSNFFVLNTIKSTCTYFGVLNVFLFSFGLIIWYKKYKTFHSPCIYFVLACFLCWYGQIIVRGFNLLPNSLIEIDLFDTNSFINTARFLTLGFNLLFLGMIIFYKKSPTNLINAKEGIKNNNLKGSLTTVALILILVGAYGHYSELIINIFKVLKYGYASLYENKLITSGLINILSNLKMFFWPGMLILLLSNKENKKIFKIVILVSIFDVVLCVLAGARSDALSLILTLFWIIYSEFKKLNLKKMIVCFVFGLIGIKMFNVINDFRISDGKSIGLFFSLILDSKSNMFVDFLSEFGFNIFSLHNTMLLIPASQPYAYGYTYFASIMAMIPSVLMGGHSFSEKAALADWLKSTLNMDYGPGFSILAESYYNFGYLGIIIMFIIGTIIGVISRNENNGDRRIIKSIIISILFYSNIFIARDTFLMVFRKALYTIVLPLFLVYILKKVLDSNKNCFKGLEKLTSMVQTKIDNL